MMPEMDGYEVCKSLKANEKTAKIPIIFVTAKGEIEDEFKGFELGCVDYITKPISPPIVTARIKTQLALKNAYEELEFKNKALVEAAKLKEEVEHITRHDLKNPLTGIFSGVGLLEFSGSLNEDQAEALEIINDSAHRILEMLNSSLDLFKMERKLYRLNPVDVNLVDTLYKIKVEFQSLIQLHKTGLDFIVNDRPLEKNETFMIKGEILLVYSLLSNLIKNAIEATPENETIHVKLSRQIDDGVICIHNKGSVPSEIQVNFFEKYVTSGKESGTGIGTYSAKLITTTLGGKISMTSMEPDGTKIIVELPT